MKRPRADRLRDRPESAWEETLRVIEATPNDVPAGRAPKESEPPPDRRRSRPPVEAPVATK